MNKITYTITDEAPALATASWLPVVEAYCSAAGIAIETKDISLAGRILAAMSPYLPAEHQVADALAELGELVQRPEANIIKLPNISASLPQLTEAIAELQSQGVPVPDYPTNPADDRQRDIQQRYSKVLGSAVNPVLREGNSDRRVAKAVKEYARKHPHSMGQWSNESKTHVASMSDGDFYGSERSCVVESGGTVRIELIAADGQVRVLRESVELDPGEVIDAAVMHVARLRAFFADEIEQARRDDILLSLHLKATMMKVSDPVIFGHAVEVFFDEVFQKHRDALQRAGVNPNNGLGDLLKKIEQLDAAERAAIAQTIEATWQRRPRLAMVDSDRGITNLHAPNDVIIDASMPAAIRAGGKMWGPDGKMYDTKALIPDRSYAGVYQAVIEDCKQHGAFDPRTMGSVSNVGLMAKKAEEYGSHDKTFVVPAAGTVRVVHADGRILFEHTVEPGDIWRMCQTKDIAIRDWVQLAVRRARATGAATVFWLDEDRAHDQQLRRKVETYLADHDTTGLDISILSPVQATQLACQRARQGLDTVTVTGNVLRDYLTDLFPILELGTSAKMLSIVPLLAGGGLFETGAGGSAPKHVQQFLQEGHLRWDSLGEFLALAVSLEEMAEKTGNPQASVLATTLDQATGVFLENDKSPSRKVNEIDTRGSHFYMALYWAQTLASQTTDAELAQRFAPVAAAAGQQEETIQAELLAAQGHPVDIGGYYHPDPQRVNKEMRPSQTWNEILAQLSR
ncbi:MAG: NADP-dependent isocitrate dehydrogenase [Planctomycetota bacterium]|nr:MAG: NADP-dependent isocitrate dehydrogenase [Planctomycetota bacterium]